jgi:CelD/BcsL family acetyltransferase involved in cellulose biosynthesis
MAAEMRRAIAGKAGRAAASLRVLRGGAVAALGPDWDALAARALEENPFFARPYVEAGLRCLDRPGEGRILCVRRVERGGTGRLIGLFPLVSSRFRYGLPFALNQVGQNVFQTCGTPLLDREHAEEAADAILAALRGGAGLAPNLLVPNLRRDGAVAQLLCQRAEAASVRTAFVEEVARPILRPGPEPAQSYFERTVSAKRLRELRRSHRRLAEAGALRYRHTREPAELADAVEAFLRLEMAGWKGRRGTAFRSNPAWEAFARAAFLGQDGGGPIASADILALDSVPIAVCLNLQIGRTSFAIKTTYDEAYRRFSPGLVLEYLVVEHLFDARYADEIDSCTTENGHVIGDLWDGQAAVGTLVLTGHPSGIDLAAAERARARAKMAYRAAQERGVAMRSYLGMLASTMFGGDEAPRAPAPADQPNRARSAATSPG